MDINIRIYHNLSTFFWVLVNSPRTVATGAPSAKFSHPGSTLLLRNCFFAGLQADALLFFLLTLLFQYWFCGGLSSTLYWRNNCDLPVITCKKKKYSVWKSIWNKNIIMRSTEEIHMGSSRRMTRNTSRVLTFLKVLLASYEIKQDRRCIHCTWSDFNDRMQCDRFFDDIWRQSEAWIITLSVGAVAVNSLAQRALLRVTQWPWTEHLTFQLVGGNSTTELIAAHLVLDRPLDRFPAGVASTTCITNLSWGILVTWPKHHSWDLFIQVAGHSGLDELHNCPLCREVSRSELFAKIPSLPLELGIELFLLLKIQDTISIRPTQGPWHTVSD